MSEQSSAGRLRTKLEHHVQELPVLPTVVAKLMALDPNAQGYFDEVLRLVEMEPNFSARILSVANSSASAPRGPITTLAAGIARIGILTATNLVLALSVARVFVPKDDWEKSLWRHALQVAIAARALVRNHADPDLNPDEAYASGLMHDIGRFIMFQEAPEELRKVDEGDWDSAEKLLEMELSICGLTHAELGALVCSKWNLPEAVLQVVKNHHLPPQGPLMGKTAKTTAVIRAADVMMFPSAMPGTPGWDSADQQTVATALLPRLPSFLRMTASGLQHLIQMSIAEADKIAVELGLGVSPPPAATA